MKTLYNIILGFGVIGSLVLPFVAWQREWPEPRFRACLFMFATALFFGLTARSFNPWLALGGSLLLSAAIAWSVYYRVPIVPLVTELPKERVIRPDGAERKDYVVAQVFDARLFGREYFWQVVLPACAPLLRLKDPHDTTVWVDRKPKGARTKCVLYFTFSGGLTPGVSDFLGWWRGTLKEDEYRENCLLPLSAIPVFKRRADGVFVGLWKESQWGLPETGSIETEAGTLGYLNAVYVEDSIPKPP